MTVCIVSDRRMREYNRKYRGRNESTDVLEFPSGSELQPDGSRYLGDIIISATMASNQARAEGHSFSRELKILALHGYLHLVGYDHQTDRGAFKRLQRRIISKLLGDVSRKAMS